MVAITKLLGRLATHGFEKDAATQELNLMDDFAKFAVINNGDAACTGHESPLLDSFGPHRCTHELGSWVCCLVIDPRKL